MKKSTKVLLRVLPVLLLVVFVLGGNVLAVSPTVPSAGGGVGSINTVAQNIWGTVLVILQILAFAALIFAGVRYMFASADQKADIKNQTVILIVGAIIVFGASAIAGFIANVANEVFQ